MTHLPRSSGASLGASVMSHVVETRHYAAFGGVISSELEFPELVATDALQSDWTLRIGTDPLDDAIEMLGERRVHQEEYRLLRTPRGLRLEYSHAGTFDIDQDGRQITWFAPIEPRTELARAIVLGPVLALALELTGHFCLHGSAVEIANQGVAFVGPKFHGKSTLAVALTSAGARFLGDDTLAVLAGPPAVLRPGIPSVRLWEDAARTLRIRDLCDTVFGGIKTTAAGFADPTTRRSDVALGAVYVLEPVAPEQAATIALRERMAPMAGAVALAHYSKLPDPLVGYAAAGTRLKAAVAIASTVPVYTLRVARTFDLLPLAVETILGWHSGESASAAEP